MWLGFLDVFINIVWESLFNFGDDLSVSIGRVMDFFVMFCSFFEVLDIMKVFVVKDEECFFMLFVFRLYFFLRYIIIFVCFVVFKVFFIFVNFDVEVFKGWFNGCILWLIFQNIFVERD